MNQQKTNVNEIDLLALCRALLKKWQMLVLVALCGAVLMLNYTEFLVKPTYTSTTKVYIMTKYNSEQSSVTTSDLSISAQFTEDYMDLVKSRTVIEGVISTLDLNYSYEKLAGNVSASATSNSSRILNISVVDTDPKLAMEIANEIREMVSAQITETTGADAVNVVEYANLPTSKTSPSLMKNCIIGALVGFVIMAAIIVVEYLMDDSIKTVDDVEKYLGLNVLTTIPALGSNDKKKKRRKKVSRKAGKK